MIMARAADPTSAGVPGTVGADLWALAHVAVTTDDSPIVTLRLRPGVTVSGRVDVERVRFEMHIGELCVRDATVLPVFPCRAGRAAAGPRLL